MFTFHIHMSPLHLRAPLSPLHICMYLPPPLRVHMSSLLKSHLILSMLSCASATCRVSTGDIQGIPAKFVLSLEDATITEEMLSHDELSSCSIPGLYEAQHTIKLFCYTFTIAPLSHDHQRPKTSKKASLQPTSGLPSSCKEYLMMCLLPAITDVELPQHIASSPHIVPLVVKFMNDCVPLRCFGSTISCLLSTFKW